MKNKEWFRANREAWRQRVDAFKQTSQTALEWSKNNNVDYKALLRWRSKFESENSADTLPSGPNFKEIVDSSSNCPLVVELNNCKVHIPLNFNKQHLLECLQILGFRC